MTGLVRWWTEINPTEITPGGASQEEVKTSTKIFALNLTKLDQVNKVLTIGMTKKDEFLYANGGGAEALWKLIDLEAQHTGTPQTSKAGGNKGGARGDKGGGSQQFPAAGPHMGTISSQSM